MDPRALPEPTSPLGGVPVLLYQGMAGSVAPRESPVRPDKYRVAAADFRAQLADIKRIGYDAARLDEVWGRAPDGRVGRKLALTFDDGRAEDYEVTFPALLEAGMPGEFFVNTATVGQDGFLSWAQIAEMHRAGMSFQSHGHEHAALTRLPINRLRWQLGESKRRIEDRLGAVVHFLAVPYGLVSRSIVDVAGQVGYRAVCTSRSWPARPGKLTVPRVTVYRHTSLDEFRRLLAGDVAFYVARAVRAALAYVPKHLILRVRPSMLGVRVLAGS